MSQPPPPPSPLRILRIHGDEISTLAFSNDNERLYSGDTSGRVVITSTRTMRPLAAWNAHTDGILGVQEWGNSVITHGRDNKLHVWKRVLAPSISVGDSAAVHEDTKPDLLYSMDVNALNYCRFSLWSLPSNDDEEPQALVALPNLVESSMADVWSLPARDRLHAAIGKKGGSTPAIDGRGEYGIIMSMHLFEYQHPATSTQRDLRLLLGYESGAVTLWSYTRDWHQKSIEGMGWESRWTAKLHVESGTSATAFTVSADHLVGRYDVEGAESSVEAGCKAYPIKQVGNAAVAIRDDGRICAIAGWDGRVRLFSTKSLKPLGTLSYHKGSCQTVHFARTRYSQGVQDEADDDDEIDDAEKRRRGQWLVSGGKDSRIAIWPLMSFTK
ncbi:WD40 repeat-like protein [Punctularia strigosozonata HHB-11173 SS5]|uniref:ASTRA-associated protein 1 n=1 Tax=Punctularia strigosozonata (strain HHB-11173) TaxID=741275 RepID=R7S1Q0_PUNST|nr:WD40 repeat-like protein [Punctularia strigosozonata HHB-11173 SS5]EIN03764.1 WD40 repeat-like protein [Punctularia strigosozonata HHB-11173 SS5]